MAPMNMREEIVRLVLESLAREGEQIKRDFDTEKGVKTKFAAIDGLLPDKLARTLAGFVESFAQGLAVMRQPVRLLVSLALSFPLWMSIAAGIWTTSRAFHMTFDYLGSFLIMTLLVVGVAMPTPGQVGGFHAMYRIAVTTFLGVPEATAVGAAIVLHAVSFVPVTLLGLAFMAGEGLSLGRMREMAARQNAPPSGVTQ